MVCAVATVTERILDRNPMEEIAKAFRLMDDDGTHRISLKNLRRVARDLGEDMTDEELKAMIDEFDLDKDGESESKGNFFHPNIILSIRLSGTLTLPYPFWVYPVNEEEFLAIMTADF